MKAQRTDRLVSFLYRRDAPLADLEPHQVLTPDDPAIEHALNLVNDLLSNAGLINLRQQVG